MSTKGGLFMLIRRNCVKTWMLKLHEIYSFVFLLIISIFALRTQNSPSQRAARCETAPLVLKSVTVTRPHISAQSHTLHYISRSQKYPDITSQLSLSQFHYKTWIQNTFRKIWKSEKLLEVNALYNDDDEDIFLFHLDLVCLSPAHVCLTVLFDLTLVFLQN